MTSPGAATPGSAVLGRATAAPIGLIKEQVERMEVLLVRMSEQSQSARRIRMKFCGMEPEPEAPTEKVNIPDDFLSRFIQNNNQLEELLNGLELDLNKLDNAY